MKFLKLSAVSLACVAALTACGPKEETTPKVTQTSKSEYYGTKNSFAKESVYFLMTDRFVDGDPSNNYPDQGGDYPTFDRELVNPEGKQNANVGYLGGDFKGIANNIDYLTDMGFSALWITPIVDNPDMAFNGGEKIEFAGQFKDGGKTGYHGYWGVNFFAEDEHLVSPDLNYKTLNQALKSADIKPVMDIVLNHGSPSYTMDVDLPKFGEIYDKNGKLLADHQNLHPTKLDPNNPLHSFFYQQPDLAELSDMNADNPAVLDYFVEAYLYWIEQGAEAFRIDTIRHMPHHLWKRFSDRIREKHPDFFMFGESFEYEATKVAQHTLPKNGEISVLDFPGQRAMTQLFENKDASYADIQSYLHLTHGPYHNPYDLMTFYDNHDMARMNTDEKGFINANNWLFTSRGIPVVYYGSEIGFMAGLKEHEGNRNYYGQENIDKAPQHAIYQNLKRINLVRQNTPALQSGLQVNLAYTHDTASFLRVLEVDGTYQTALVVLNKSDQEKSLILDKWISNGLWNSQINSQSTKVEQGTISVNVPANGVEVLVLNQVNNNADLYLELDKLMENK
ncbi:cyclomaltodextrin glucanotransferase [Paraglaciecola aquimarina]|uniref:Cyclomaltodextrin glucanotransferase n=1 Tax=Paraglaciecola algarum TaxID=3050085 RepID=A0ABS9DAB8_9ALTE|nr:alpha-amylase family glycosyl hydrolase [Paraglaciecola sp. G1-23]MCF2949859.1 cyclomaltodextrin glucanotransferase [Paraglaciecola sp. G1-23]